MTEVKIKRLLGDRILAKRIREEHKGLVVLPDNPDCQKALVLQVGPGLVSKAGKLIPMPVKVGDVVYFSKHTDTDVPGLGEDVVMFNSAHLLAVEEPEDVDPSETNED